MVILIYYYYNLLEHQFFELYILKILFNNVIL